MQWAEELDIGVVILDDRMTLRRLPSFA